MTTTRQFNLLLLLLAGVGCDTRSVIGREPPPGTPSSSGGAPGGSASGGQSGQTGSDQPDAAPPLEDAAADLGLPLIVDPQFTVPDNLVGTWKGYLQAATFRSGSDTVVVNLIRAAGEPDRITVTLGDTAPPSTPPYPLNASRGGGPSFYLEGLPYPAHQVLWRGSRLTFQIANGDLYRSWCATQVPQIDPHRSPESYTCAALDDTIRSLCYRQEPPLPEACAAYLVCNNGLCVCNASLCAADTALTAAFDITFDLPVVGATTVGGVNVTLRLAREPL